MEGAEARARRNKIITHIVLIIMAFIMLVPFAWMVLTALKTNQEAISVNPFYIFPHSGWHWENFGTVWKSYNFVILYKLCFRKTELPVQECAVRAGTDSDDGTRTDLHHPAVPDGVQDGNAQYDLRSGVPGSCYRIRYLSAEDRL